MMEMMKKNMAGMVPQMIIMGWVTYFFNGFVAGIIYACRLIGIVKLPFPLPLRFKTMLQSGIDTADMDVTWVSSLSWYFINFAGLNSIFGLILGEGNGLCPHSTQTLTFPIVCFVQLPVASGTCREWPLHLQHSKRLN